MNFPFYSCIAWEHLSTSKKHTLPQMMQSSDVIYANDVYSTGTRKESNMNKLHCVFIIVLLQIWQKVACWYQVENENMVTEIMFVKRNSR